MSFKPTPEQDSIIESILNPSAGSLDVDALAGAAKSTTLRLAAERMKSGRKCLALAFNVTIKQALEKSMPEFFDCLTLNGLGHRAWQRFVGGSKIKVEENKNYRICRRIIEDEGLDGDEGKASRETLQAIVNAARSHGLVPKGDYPVDPKGLIPDTPEGWLQLADVADLDYTADNVGYWSAMARIALQESIAQAFAGVIDFPDQLYMPVCFNGAFPRYDVVFGDEIQDFSPINLIQVRKTVGSGRFIGVGDERQSIYAFRGADPQSIPRIRETFKTSTLKLTTTFRCAKNIVSNVHWRAPEMQAAPWAPDGEVVTWQDWNIGLIPTNSAVICRNNAPLISLGFKLLRAGVPITFIGGEIQKSLINFIRKIANADASMSANLFYSKLDKWEAEEIKEAQDRNSPSRADRAKDKADTIRALPGKTAGDLVTALEKIFSQKNGIITFTSGHKSKGLEFDTVIHLEPHLVPSRFATTESQVLQEQNLKYVIDTRAKTRHIYAALAKLDGDVE